jgi:hypothetical protein
MTLNGRIRSLGTTDVTLTSLPQPILTSQISLGDIVFTASPLGATPQWNFGHVIPFNLEVYGCDNYQIDESKSIVPLSLSLSLTHSINS